MATKRDDRANNPLAGEVAFSGFQIDPAIREKMHLSDAQFALIGKVTVHWARIESDVSMCIALLRGHIGSEEDAALIDNLPFEKRLSILGSELADAGSTNAEAIERVKIIAEESKWKRDALAHGSLGFNNVDASASFFLPSRKKEFFMADAPALEAASSEAADIMSRVYRDCLTSREDRRGTPLHWMLAQFSTSAKFGTQKEPGSS